MSNETEDLRFFDIWWETSVEARTEEEALAIFAEQLRKAVDSGKVNVVYREPDVDDTDFEATVEVPATT